MSCSSSSCACSENKTKISEPVANKVSNNDDDFFSNDHHESHDALHEDRDMERRTMNRLCTTARNRGKMDETQKMEIELTRKSFCEGFAAGVDEGKLMILRYLKE